MDAPMWHMCIVHVTKKGQSLKKSILVQLGTIHILRKHWTGWVGSENGSFCLLSVHIHGWVRKSPKTWLHNIWMVPYQPFTAKLVMRTQGMSMYCMDQLSVIIHDTDRLPLYVISKRVLSNRLGYLISHIITIKMDHIHISLLISKFSR